MSLTVCLAVARLSVWLSITERSGLTKTPPLKPAIGVRRANGAINIAMPRGGLPLVMAKAMSAAASDFTASAARAGQRFVPSEKRAIDISEHK